MPKTISRIVAGFSFFLSFIFIAMLISTAEAKADYFNYPCSPGGQGTGVDVNALVIDASGQFCDGPTQWNLSHAHCLSGGAGTGGASFAFPFGNGSISGLGRGGIGGSGANCQYQCPDGTASPAPNPPFYGSSAPYVDARKVILANRAFCVVGHHLVSAGRTSDIVRPEEGDPDKYVPGPDLQDLVDKNEAQIVPPPAPVPAPSASNEATARLSD